jgi:CubicO group peptidase (beta-lactamase class C family)
MGLGARNQDESLGFHVQSSLETDWMESYGFWMLDGPEGVGRGFSDRGFNAVARDYARLGLLMLRNRRAGDGQVIPQAWVRESTRPAVRDVVDPAEPALGHHYTKLGANF